MYVLHLLAQVKTNIYFIIKLPHCFSIFTFNERTVGKLDQELIGSSPSNGFGPRFEYLNF